MRILLTGACGVLGRAVRYVAQGRHELVLLDNNPAVAEAGGIQCDVTDEKALTGAMPGCDAVMHTAAVHGGFRGKVPDSRFLQTNVVGAESLLRIATAAGVKRVVLASTMEILLNVDWGGYGTALLDESLPPRPRWIYPLSKLMAEQLGSYYARVHGREVVSLRYMAFGPQPMRELGLSLVARYLVDSDAAAATLAAATTPGLRDEILHIGPESPLDQEDVNEGVFGDPWKVLERRWPGSGPLLRRHGVEPKPHHFYPVTRIDRARQALQWRPKTTFADYLRWLGEQPAKA